MIRLVTITPDNWRLGLSVREDKYDYVSDSSGILARTYAYRDNRSQAFVIYDDNVPVGMAMYHDLDDWKAYDFSQFFIDHRYQRKGYGLKAAEMILEKMKADGKYDRVVLCYINGDEAAKNLYEKLGFHHTGQADEDEIIMEKNFTVNSGLLIYSVENFALCCMISPAFLSTIYQILCYAISGTSIQVSSFHVFLGGDMVLRANDKRNKLPSASTCSYFF